MKKFIKNVIEDLFVPEKLYSGRKSYGRKQVEGVACQDAKGKESFATHQWPHDVRPRRHACELYRRGPAARRFGNSRKKLASRPLLSPWTKL